MRHRLLAQNTLRQLRIRNRDECVQPRVVPDLVIDLPCGHGTAGADIETDGFAPCAFQFSWYISSSARFWSADSASRYLCPRTLRYSATVCPCSAAVSRTRSSARASPFHTSGL